MVLALAVVWSVLGILRSRKLNVPARILLMFTLATSFFIGIDVLTGFYRWSTTYLVPLMTIAVTLTITLMVLIRRRSNYGEYLGYLLAILIISLVPLLFFAFQLSNRLWTSIAALVYSLLTVVALWTFTGKDFKSELSKRFHF